MSRELCVIHANCQGEPLMERLLACPGFAARYECRLFTNYVREPIPASVLEGCGLFLYQHLGPGWGELGSDFLRSRLPESARSLCIPNMFFLGYWPFWNSEPGFNYRDGALEELIAKGLSGEEILTLYLRSRLTDRYDLAALLEQTFAREREREAHTPVKYVDLIEREFRGERLFNTVNHPGPRLLNHMAAEVLLHLELEPPENLFSMPDAFPEFVQPIHPQVAAFHHLEFAGPDTEYEVYGKKKTFVQYAACYIEARLAGIEDFIGYLQVR
ncbi:WcbI family polysaccharide biosynthesis putative acetyltransferase [Salidesulfovibrio onnuriiensis]|uniref:WcbI family polysaccharide biosynthesis putative acetyltransferase n=1 Tax=Salidesulfovibrio onnuriiensis TaxID=2583823 RepID=UPI0011CCBA3D|nr:WcbI family polysaccharide biosynthesis putative acetyltransferase [Salidesulfovibrio onnuriiensis]